MNIDYNLLKPADIMTPNQFEAGALNLQNQRGQNQIQQQGIADKSKEASLAQMRKQALIDAKGDIGLAGQSLARMGDMEGAAMAQKQVQETTKGSADIETKFIPQYLISLDIIGRTGTIDGVIREAQRLKSLGATWGATYLETMAQEHPDASAEEIRAFSTGMTQAFMSPKDKMPKYQDGTQTNPYAQGAPQTLPMSPYQQGSLDISKGNLAVNQGRLGLEKQRLNQAMLKESPSSVKNQLAAEKTQTSANNSIKMLNEMEKLVESDPRSTATLAAPLARFAESVMAFWEPSTPSSSTPAIRMTQLRDSFLATVEALKKDGRMSNQDRQRLENAIGSGSFTSPESTKSAIKVVRDIVKSMSENGTGASGNWKDL